MKKFIYVSGMIFIASVWNVMAQQINNPGFEAWDNLGSSTEEPTNWNSFKTASGTLSSFGSQQVIHSSVIRPGSSGIYSALIWSKSTLGIIANGVLTTGQVNMGNMSPSDPSNYNVTHTADPNFRAALGARPDSMVFWVKFVPANSGGSDQARMSAIIHDTYDYRDPTTSDVNGPNHVVATAALDFPKTNGLWERKALLFNYTGPASSPDFILITFTTNGTPGGGSAADSLYIDDISMIYNDSTGIAELSNTGGFLAYFNPATTQLSIDLNFDQASSTKISIFDITGQLIHNSILEAGNTKENINLEGLSKGMYFVKVITADGYKATKKFVIY